MPSVNWTLARGKQRCYFAIGQKQLCGEPAVVHASAQSSFSLDGLCVDHMGSFQWVTDDGVLCQWRADPPYTKNKIPRKYERWRKRVVHEC